MTFYIKPNSNCGGLPLTSLESLLGGEWETGACWTGRPVIATGEDLVPRQVVGWASLFGGSPVDVNVYRRTDGKQIALLGADWGVRILANDEELPETAEFTSHLPAGWGTPLLTVEDFTDIETDDLLAAVTA